jgi:hypothetical protein
MVMHLKLDDALWKLATKSYLDTRGFFGGKNYGSGTRTNCDRDLGFSSRCRGNIINLEGPKEVVISYQLCGTSIESDRNLTLVISGGAEGIGGFAWKGTA